MNIGIISIQVISIMYKKFLGDSIYCNRYGLLNFISDCYLVAREHD